MKQRLIAVTCLALFTWAPGAKAQTTADTLRALDQCGSIADEHQRLSCFDQLGPQVKGALLRIPGAKAGPPTAQEQKNWFGFDLGGLFGSAPAQQTSPDKFGSDQLPQKPQPKQETASGDETPLETLDSISAGVSEVSFTRYGKFIVFLDNGQVWRQIEADTDKASFESGGNTVKISRAMFGSYQLTVNDSAKVFKVKRVK
jgi:hypothetical protein